MMRVVGDEPGRALELAWEGSPPLLWQRLVLPLLWLGLLALSGGMAAALWKDSASSFTQARDRAYALLTGGFVLAAGGAALWAATPRAAYWRRLRLDAGTGEASGQRVDLLWLPLRRARRLSEARGMTVATGTREGAALTLLWAGGESWRVPLHGLDERRRALGLLFAAARILRWPAYATTRSDGLGLEVALLTEAGPGAQPVPPLPDERPALPPLQAPPFVPGSCSWRSGIQRWEPGSAVELETYYDTGAFWLLGVLGASFAFFIFAAGAALGRPWAAFPAGAVLAYFVWVLARESPDPGPLHARLDWSAGTARFWSPRFNRTIPLASIDSLLLDGARVRVGDDAGRGSHDEFLVRLRAHADGRYELLAEGRVCPDPEDALVSVLSAALPLAKTLGVALDFHDFPQPLLG